MQPYINSLLFPQVEQSPATSIPTGDVLTHEYLHNMAEDLKREHLRLKGAVTESLRLAREAYADVFILQSQLDQEIGFYSKVVDSMSGILGGQAMREIKERGDNGEPQDLPRGTKRKRISTSHYVVHSKKPRLQETITDTILPRTILNYSTSEGTDGTYSDSNGDEEDFIDDPYSYYEICEGEKRNPLEALPMSNNHRLSTDEDSNIDSPVPDLNDDWSDLDYEPPEWDLEDIWEIEKTQKYYNIYGEQYHFQPHPLYQFSHNEDHFDCEGFLSDDGLTTEDSDRKTYRDPRVLERPFHLPPTARSLGEWHLRQRTEKPARGLQRWDAGLDKDYYAKHRARALKAHRKKKCEEFLGKLLAGQVGQINVEDRLNELLDDDYHFDDEEYQFMEARWDSL